MSYYVPYVTASVAVVGVWLFLFNSNGLVNSRPRAARTGPVLAGELAGWRCRRWRSIVTWKQLGFFILLYLAALQNVSKDLYEAASMDGASRWKSFLNVTVPGVRPATTLVVLLATVTGANLFTEPYLLTGGGGPDGASASPVLIMYQRGIEQGHPDVAVRDRVSSGHRRSSLLALSRTPARRGKDPHRSGTFRRTPRSIGAFVFLFPFYYMLIGSLQAAPDPSVAGAFPKPGNLTLHNYAEINKAINLAGR